MGYYFNSYGEDSIAIPDSAEVAFALMRDAMYLDLEKVNSFERQKNEIITNPDSSLVRHWLENIGFEVEETDYGIVHMLHSQESGTIYSGYFDEARYLPGTPIVLDYLARAGVGISITCVGEDSEMWRYHSVVGPGNLATIDLELGTREEVSLARKIKRLMSLADSAKLTEAEQSLIQAIQTQYPKEAAAIMKPVSLSLEDVEQTLRVRTPQ